MLNETQFLNAISLLSKQHSTKLSINLPVNNFVGNLGKNTYRITIHECVPAVIDNLKEAGYILCMTPEGLTVSMI